MIVVELKEALELYPACENLSEGGFTPGDSPLRKKAEELFHQSYISHMYFVSALVYRTMAQEYMKDYK